jgi:hypothetical protein
MNNPLSYSSVKIDLYSREGARLKQASGFMVEAEGNYFLITNWHVLSGKDFALPQDSPIDVPFTLRTSLHIYSGEGENKPPLSWGMWRRITIPLYDKNNAPTWTQPQNKQNQPKADVAVLPVSKNESLLLNASLRLFTMRSLAPNTHSEQWSGISAIPISSIDTKVEYGPPDRVNIIGFPHGWAPNGTDKSSTAFWRTASIASEIYETGMSRWEFTFFIDPCPPGGMTGSPVLGFKNDRLKLLGVYSDNSTAGFDANAGIVWDAWLVKELVGSH